MDYDKLIDEILKSDIAEEEREDHPEVGINAQYFSEHSRNIAIIENFDYSEEWIDAHPDLKSELEKYCYDWWKDEYHDEEVFMTWFEGGEVKIRADGYIEDLVKELTRQYRLRIKETHNCSKCGREISEAHGYYESNSLHRVGHALDTIPLTYEYKLYCKDCFDERIHKK